MSFVLSIVDAVPQKQCSHLLVARFSQVFVLQLVHHGDVSASPACFSERLECFFLCCLETFLDLRFELDIPDLLAQMRSGCKVCFCSLSHFSSPA